VNSKAGVPAGSVTFFDGTTVLGTARVNDAGQAIIRVSLGVGNHTLTASFAGTGGFADSTSAAVTETVNRASTTVALGSSVNPAATGQAVTFTATVAIVAPGAGAPTGTVTFRDGNVVLGTAAVSRGGTATFTASFAAAGGHVITAVYSGDANFVASSQSLTEQVNAPTTHKSTITTLLASANPARVGQAVTFTATVRDPAGTSTPTGTVSFFVGNTVVARVTLDANGQARLRGSFSVAGPFTIRAVYSGDATFDASSQSLIEQVNR
jgi:Bacterial Ig-like domain (group 3)